MNLWPCVLSDILKAARITAGIMNKQLDFIYQPVICRMGKCSEVDMLDYLKYRNVIGIVD